MNDATIQPLSRWSKNGCSPPPRAIKLILWHLNRVAIPQFVGTLSVMSGYSISQTLAVLLTLEESNSVRRLTELELSRLGYESYCDISCLTVAPSRGEASD